MYISSCPLLQTLTSHLNYDHPHLPTALCSLAQVARLYPAVFKLKHKAIISEFVVKKLLVQDRVRRSFWSLHHCLVLQEDFE